VKAPNSVLATREPLDARLGLPYEDIVAKGRDAPVVHESVPEITRFAAIGQHLHEGRWG
jgi:hypothetical protein